MKICSIILSFLLINFCSTAQQPDSLAIKIGQMILIGMPKAEVDSLVLNDVRNGKVGTLILFEKNVPKSGAAFASLKKMLWTYQQAAPIPLLIAIDQEGGKVNRLKDKYGFPRSITASEMGKAKTLDSVRFYAESIASNLAGLGFNVNFAPVVDVTGNSNPNNPIYAAGRSFSSNADSVTLLAREYIKPHRKFGVITVLKHFPGHGSSQADTHFGLADVTDFWKDSELNPYRKLVSEGYVDAIMSAHIVNRKIDPAGLPGTLSHRALDSLLRKGMGYQGVIFSDDMQMHAISKLYSLEEAITRAINSGIDILCFSNNIPNTEQRAADMVYAVIRDAVAKGTISKKRIDESYHRIMKLKASLNTQRLEFYQREAARLQVELSKKEGELKSLQANANSPGKKKKKSKRNKA